MIRKMIGIFVTTAVTTAVLAHGQALAQPVAPPPTTQHVTVDLSTPKAAVRTMLAAVEQADGSALRESFFAADPQQRDLATAYSELIVAGRHLRDAAREKFGSENGTPVNPAMVRDGTSSAGVAPEDEQQLANAVIQTDGDTASVQLPDRTPIKLRRSDNLWRIDLADYAAVPVGQLIEQTEVNHNLAAALEEASEEISAGKYASAQEAESAVQQKIHGVIAPQLKNLAATQPATRPAQ